MRVLPSSVMVVRSAPITAFAVSTGTGFGNRPATINAMRITAPAYGNQRRARGRSFPGAELTPADRELCVSVVFMCFESLDYSGARSAPMRLSLFSLRNTINADAVEAMVTMSAAIA